MHVAITADPMLPVPPRLYGGIERVIDMLARGLVARGHRVTLVAHRDSETAGRLVPYPSESATGALGLVRNTLAVARLAALRPDVVHSFGRLATLAPLLPLGVPKVMSYQREPTLKQVRLAARLARRGTLSFTGCAEHIAALMRPYAPSVAVFNGVPMDTYAFRAAVPDDAPLVFLGRVERIKGAHTAIAVAKAAGRRLVIAGNVPPEAQGYFDAEVAPHLGDAVTYVGPVDDAQKDELLGGALAFLMPIEWEEPFGIVMAEALACGTPIVGTPRGSVPEVVREGVTGFIAPTVAGMAEAVGRVGSLSRAACRADCEARFSDTAIVDAYEALYFGRIAGAHRGR
jgi:glycosyltransferase involved in cell wall biosynthesis